MESTAMADRSDGGAERVRAVYAADHARLWRSLYAFTGSRDIADEAAAEAFAQALRRGGEIRDVAAWVWRSAYAIARGEMQRRRRSGVEPPPDRVAPEPDELAGLLAALAALGESDRELIVLCHVAGWKPGELAAVLDANPGAIRVRLHRATARAREILERSGR